MAKEFHWSPYFTDEYDPLQAGSIDRTDEFPHDRAISRALAAKYKPNKSVVGDPKCTLFVGRLNPETTDETVMKEFSKCGKVKRVRLVRDIVTGTSKRYAFVEYEDRRHARRAWDYMHKARIDDHEILVEWENERTMKGWVPRRLGGGLSGRKESGQLRFGGRDKPFKKPIIIGDDHAGPSIYLNKRDRTQESSDPFKQTQHRSRDVDDNDDRKRRRSRSHDRNSRRESSQNDDHRSDHREHHYRHHHKQSR